MMLNKLRTYIDDSEIPEELLAELLNDCSALFFCKDESSKSVTLNDGDWQLFDTLLLDTSWLAADTTAWEDIT